MFMLSLEGLLADFLGDHSPDAVSAKAVGGRMLGPVSALVRGGAARLALGQRAAVQWAFRAQVRQQVQQPPHQTGPPPGQLPPRFNGG